MPHLSTPGPDTGLFSTLEVRPRSKPTKLTSRNIAFPANHYTEPPNVAAGFKMLDLSHKAPIRANLVGSDLTTEGFKILFETWGGGELNAAEAQWIEHKHGAKECWFGVILCSAGTNRLRRLTIEASNSTHATSVAERAMPSRPLRPLPAAHQSVAAAL